MNPFGDSPDWDGGWALSTQFNATGDFRVHASGRNAWKYAHSQRVGWLVAVYHFFLPRKELVLNTLYNVTAHFPSPMAFGSGNNLNSR
jgi:hypothetical protein